MQEEINTIKQDTVKIDDFEALSRVAQVFLDTKDQPNLVQKVVDSVLGEVANLGQQFHVAVLALSNTKTNYLERTAISRTVEADDIQASSDTKFQEIKTPLNAHGNFCILAMETRKHYLTHTFEDILTPPFTEQESRELQKAGNIKTSVVFPIIVKGEPIGIVIFSTRQYIEELPDREVRFIESLANIIGIAVENSKLYLQLEQEKEKLEIANQKLIDLDKAKDEFLSVATHELRTPMTVIKSYVWMLLSGKAGDLTQKQKDYLDKADRGTNRMLNLINDMLNISRIEQGKIEFKIEYIKLNEFLDDIVTGFETRAQQRGIYLRLRTNNTDIKCTTDGTKLTEIMTNLVGNAIKFTKDGGVTIDVQDLGDRFKISIIDTGAGIDPKGRSKLFTKFGRLDSSYTTVAESGGTGLGLYIVKLYVQRQGGQIGVKSEGVLKGSTFWFTLPKRSVIKSSNTNQ